MRCFLSALAVGLLSDSWAVGEDFFVENKRVESKGFRYEK